jgi:hypothetical protein
MQNQKPADSTYDTLPNTYNPKQPRGNYGVFTENKKGVGYENPTVAPVSTNYQTSGNLEKEEKLQFPEEFLSRK